MQNKLFPIIHEKRVQGIDLEELAYRWSAMNPPRSEEDLEAAYVGSEPLDAALADRFAFVVEVPAWCDFSEEEQARVIRTRDAGTTLVRDPEFTQLVLHGRRLFAEQKEELESSLVGYVRFLVSLLARAGIALSPRRAGMLLRNILAVHAANCLLRVGIPLKDSALLAVTHSLPQKAQGIRIDQVKLLAAHREAWNAAQIPEDDPSRAVFHESDPVRRVMKASLAPSLSQEDFSSIVADALAALPTGGRHALAFRLFESASAGRLVAAIAEQCAELYALVTVAQDVHESVGSRSTRHRTWQRIEGVLARLDPERKETVLKTNLLCGLFSTGQLTVEEEVERTLAEWERVSESVCLPRPEAGEEAA
jgi:MoxR-like ATPase